VDTTQGGGPSSLSTTPAEVKLTRDVVEGLFLVLRIASLHGTGHPMVRHALDALRQR